MARFRQLAMLLALARLSLCAVAPTVVDQPEHKAQLGNAYTVPGNRLLQRLHFATLDHEPTNFPPVGNNTCVVRHHLNDGASIVVGSSISDDTFVLPSPMDEVGPGTRVVSATAGLGVPDAAAAPRRGDQRRRAEAFATIVAAVKNGVAHTSVHIGAPMIASVVASLRMRTRTRTRFPFPVVVFATVPAARSRLR